MYSSYESVKAKKLKEAEEREARFQSETRKIEKISLYDRIVKGKKGITYDKGTTNTQKANKSVE